MKPVDSSDSLTRPAGTRSRKPKMLIFSEGYVTEVDYFTALCDWVRSTSCEILADVVVMQRYTKQIGYSDPLNIVRLVDDYLRMIRTGKYSKLLFISKVLESVYSIDPDKPKSEKELLMAIETALAASGHTDEYDNINSYARAMDDVEAALKSQFSIDEFEVIHDEVDYDEEIDKICIVVDRDSDGRDEGRYNGFIEGCDERDYLPFVTNPKFELWLLLHYDISDSIELLRDPLKYKSTMRGLGKKYGIESKKIEHSTLIPKIPYAVEQVKLLCTKLSCLESERGSNLGDLMQRLGLVGGSAHDSDL